MEKVTIKLFKATQNIPTSKGTFENALLNAPSTRNLSTTCTRTMFNLQTTSYTVRVRNQKHFSYISTKTYVVGTQNDRLNETVLLSTQKYVITDG